MTVGPGRDEAPAAPVRPFVGRPGRGRAPADPAPGVGPAVRPYSLTGGRAHTRDARVGFETLLVATAEAARRLPELRFERARIAALCREPLAVAEVSAALGVPIGVGRVLAGDMVHEGLLEAHTPVRVADDVALLERLIAGVRAL